MFRDTLGGTECNVTVLIIVSASSDSVTDSVFDIIGNERESLSLVVFGNGGLSIVLCVFRQRYIPIICEQEYQAKGISRAVHSSYLCITKRNSNRC